MQITVSFLALFLFVMMASAQTAPGNEPQETADEQSGLCPTTHNLELAPSLRYWLEGVIGARTVKMYLRRGGSGVVGLFYEPKGDWKPVLLGGTWKASGIDLSAGADTQAFDPETPAPIGRLHGQFTNNVFIGQWTPVGSDRAEPARLVVVPKTECDGKVAWKQFDRPNWPFSFSYPASWRLEDAHTSSGDYISLICPDPETMAYDTDLTIREEAGKPTRESGVVRCGKEWRYDAECGDDIKESAFSHIPTERAWHGMKILDISDKEWRLYCRNGGYIALIEGIDRVYLLQDGWMRISGELNAPDIVGRIEKSIHPHTSK